MGNGYVFFFKQKTAYELRISDWSSDVCSSDLDRAGNAGRLYDEGPSAAPRDGGGRQEGGVGRAATIRCIPAKAGIHLPMAGFRSDRRWVPAFAGTHAISMSA